MQVKKTARNSCNYSTPVQVSTISRRTTPIIHDYDRISSLGAIVLGVSFGLMFLVGAWFGWL